MSLSKEYNKERFGAAQQAAFDKAVRGLASQNFERCTRMDGHACMYKKGARRCAFGWLMENPDEYFTGAAADYAAYSLEADKVFTDVGGRFSDDLQKAHDSAYRSVPGGKEDRPEQMVRNLHKLAVQYGLNTTILVEEATRLGLPVPTDPVVVP